MSRTPAITVDRLGKRYLIGEHVPYGVLRDSLAAAAGTVARIARGGKRPARREELWALRDVSFTVSEGEVIGIVGRNGSGKSTLLKVLARITEPTTGSAIVRGRVGALLEVGSGFHPELTGRENILVNGSMLGMRRREIVRRFDEIVAFAGVEAFLDTPVKHYSSGMQMRLAFAVAAHLEAHILLVDEVLAVGDAEFQRRCLGKMEEVSRAGRTVLLVSHQMGQIRRLCRTIMWLDRGQVRAIGAAGETIHAYERAAASLADEGTGGAFRGWELDDGTRVLRDGTRAFTVHVHLARGVTVRNGHFGLGLLSQADDVVAGWAFEPVDLDGEVASFSVTIPHLPLRAGLYRWVFTLYDGGNNLTGGRLVERWVAMPELAIDVRPVGHTQDAYAGLLNLPGTLQVPGHPAVLPSVGE